VDDYQKHYSDDSFWAKLKKYAVVIGRKGAEIALTLFHCMRDPGTPARAKAVIAGSLGYLIFPLDAIPDLVPGVGFSDDLGALALAIGIVAAHIKAQHKTDAKAMLTRWFGPERTRHGPRS
jgi:uncharacterized membrane protein YkvA (DUF1232 family)